MPISALLVQMDLHLIEVLLRLRTMRFVLRVATRLGGYEPALSSARERLQARSGDALLAHSGSGLVPTDAGLRLSEPSARMLRAAEMRCAKAASLKVLA